MNRFGYCSQGFMFPRSIVLPLVERTKKAMDEDYYVDMLLERWADAEDLRRYVLVPSLLQHVGRKSSKGWGYDQSASTTWNFGFEDHPLDKRRIQEAFGRPSLRSSVPQLDVGQADETSRHSVGRNRRDIAVLRGRYNKQKQVQRKSKKTDNKLYLPEETYDEFGRFIEYLYSHRLVLNSKFPQGQADELLSFWKACKRFSMPGLNRTILRRLEELHIASKLPPLAFLQLENRVYELGKDNGFGSYLMKQAAPVIANLRAPEMPQLLRLIGEGGEFAADLFHAYYKASSTAVASSLPVSITDLVTKEEGSWQTLESKAQN
ncbi:MAG: hypothetical protein Q9184_000652 [Pyrenodesmia sp. 2 TL-2023]